MTGEDKNTGQIWNISEDGLASFDGFFTDVQCEFFIDYFERAKSTGIGRIWHHSAREAGVADDSRVTMWPPNSDDFMNYTDTEDSIITTSLNLRYVMDTFNKLIFPKYVEEMKGLKDYIWSIEHAKVQKTEPSGGYHAWHTEKSCMDARDRIFVVQIYLNDVKEGGETEFLVQKKRISAKQGRCVIFPAGYTHLHRGNPPLSNPKYVLNMWAQYADPRKAG